MNHFTHASFWECFEKLPQTTRELASKNFEILKKDPQYPSLILKKLEGIGPLELVNEIGL